MALTSPNISFVKTERTVRHCATRFASWIYVAERASKLKRALRAVIDGPVYR